MSITREHYSEEMRSVTWDPGWAEQVRRPWRGPVVSHNLGVAKAMGFEARAMAELSGLAARIARRYEQQVLDGDLA